MTPASPTAFAMPGSALRHGAGLAAVAWIGAGFTWGTLAVNVAGGALTGIAAGAGVEGGARLLLVGRCLGGLTTFSAFSLETATFWDRAPWLAAAYVAALVALSLAAFWLVRRLVAGRGLPVSAPRPTLPPCPTPTASSAARPRGTTANASPAPIAASSPTRTRRSSSAR